MLFRSDTSGPAADTAAPVDTVTVDDPAVPTTIPTDVTQIDDPIVPLAAVDNVVNLPQANREETILPFTVDDNEEELIQIDDEEVPLAAIDNEEVPLAVIDEEEENEEELVEIEDAEVALAGASAKVWWSWIPVIGAVASTVDGYRKTRKNKNESGDSKKEE